MKILMSVLFVNLTICNCMFADDAVIEASASLIFEASDKPFHEFSQVLQASQLPALPSPGMDADSPTMAKVRDLLWNRVSTLNMEVTDEDGKSRIDYCKELSDVRSWLLERRSYSNLVIASFIDEVLSTSVLSSLVDGRITVDEANQIIELLEPRVTASVIIDVANGCASNSPALIEFRRRLSMGEGGSLIDLSETVANERDELIDTRPAILMPEFIN